MKRFLAAALLTMGIIGCEAQPAAPKGGTPPATPPAMTGKPGMPPAGPGAPDGAKPADVDKKGDLEAPKDDDKKDGATTDDGDKKDE